MLLLNYHFLNKQGQGKSLEEIDIKHFSIDYNIIYKSYFVAFIWNDKVKILKNRDGELGIFEVTKLKEILNSKFIESYL